MKALAALVLVAVVAVGAYLWHKNSEPFEYTADTTSTSTSTSTGTSTQGIVAYKSGVSGQIMIGPTCAVMTDPPNPNCTDKPFATLVAIFRKSDPVHAYVITQSDSAGQFSASLPPGDYNIGAGESNLPRCPITSVTVGTSTYSVVLITCDSGIR